MASITRTVQAGSRGSARTGVAGTGTAQADAPVAARPQRLEDLAGRVDRVGGQAQGAAEHVGVTARDGGEGRVRPGLQAVQQAVDGFVDRAVPAERENELEAV
jgi:hypothetical protein